MSKPKSSYTLWIIGKILRFLCVIVIFSVPAVLLWRMFVSQNPPKELRELSDNTVISEAFAANGEELTVLTQKQVSYTEGQDNYAYFNIDHCYFIKEADQVQLLLFYNKSTLERAAEAFGVDAPLPRDEEVFDLVLTQYVDVTPEGAEEREVEGIAITPTSVEISTNSLYTFCLYTFDGVDLEKDTVVVYLDIFYGDAPAEDEERKAYGTLRLYHEESITEERDLKHKEKKIIRE